MKNIVNFGKSKKNVWLYISEMCFPDLVLVIQDIHDCPESIPGGKHQWFSKIFRQNFMLFGDNLYFFFNIGTLFSGQKIPAPKDS